MKLGAAAYLRRRRYILTYYKWCRPCRRKGLFTIAVEVDHIKPKEQGGGDEEWNLQPICKDCHNEKTSIENSSRAARSGSRKISKGGRICKHGVPINRVECAKCIGGPSPPPGHPIVERHIA